MLLRHRWALEFKGFRPPTCPNDARNADRLFGAFDGLGLDTGTTAWMAETVMTYVMGAVLREVHETQTERDMAAVAASMTGEELTALLKEFEQRIRASGQYPRLVRLMDN